MARRGSQQSHNVTQEHFFNPQTALNAPNFANVPIIPIGTEEQLHENLEKTILSQLHYCRFLSNLYDALTTAKSLNMEIGPLRT